jgi:hypothetical protein
MNQETFHFLIVQTLGLICILLLLALPTIALTLTGILQFIPLCLIMVAQKKQWFIYTTAVVCNTLAIGLQHTRYTVNSPILLLWLNVSFIIVSWQYIAFIETEGSPVKDTWVLKRPKCVCWVEPNTWVFVCRGVILGIKIVTAVYHNSRLSLIIVCCQHVVMEATIVFLATYSKMLVANTPVFEKPSLSMLPKMELGGTEEKSMFSTMSSDSFYNTCLIKFTDSHTVKNSLKNIKRSRSMNHVMHRLSATYLTEQNRLSVITDSPHIIKLSHKD